MMDKQPDWMKLLEPRQVQEILFAQTYFQNFGHGTDGHHRLILLAKLADMLTRVESEGVDLLTILQTKPDGDEHG